MSIRTILAATVLTIAAAATVQAQAGLSAAASTRGTAEVSLTTAGSDAAAKTIRLDYGQPHLRGRTLHVDSLVPYDTSWRLGANAATTLETGVGLMLGSLHLDAGKYVLEALPSRTTWMLIVHRITGTNPEGENILAEVGKVALRHRTLGMPIESLSMWLIPSREMGAPRGELRFAWGTDELSIGWMVM
ncbi:MAG: DUF2911 domain-containing protein [Gemmatimonadota bacterium]|nr:DUF2911 domain-containing protein [Gemmatimonadota bacterium]